MLPRDRRCSNVLLGPDGGVEQEVQPERGGSRGASAGDLEKLGPGRVDPEESSGCQQPSPTNGMPTGRLILSAISGV